MPFTQGYVGTIDAETSGGAQLWFSLTKNATGSDWVKIGQYRAWFAMDMESADRPTHMAQLTLLLEAMRSGLPVQVKHGAVASFTRRDPNDSFAAEGVRILRAGLQF